jgi:hypothetical protein
MQRVVRHCPGTDAHSILLAEMFLKSYVEVALPFEDVRGALQQAPSIWLYDLVQAAAKEGERLLVEVGLKADARELLRTADVELGEPQLSQRTATLPVRLAVHRDGSLFPPLSGSLDAAWLGPRRLS